jgi:predicted nuclease of predicted toxin-antitoxin system
VRLLVDQDVYAVTVQLLRSAGHDVVRVAEIGMARASDSVILEAALADARVVITRDLDFGRLALDTSSKTAGIVIIRLQPALMDAVHAELLRALGEHPMDDTSTLTRRRACSAFPFKRCSSARIATKCQASTALAAVADCSSTVRGFSRV